MRGFYISRSAADLFWAWLSATALSGIPSTLYALATGGDPMEATRAAAAMLGSLQDSMPAVLAAAAVVHGSISLFWASILTWTLPRRHVVLASLAASAAIAVLDLRLIAPALFPEVAALDFWPQLADHLMWGACVGCTLAYRDSRIAPINS